MVYSKIRVEHLEELRSFLFRFLEASIAQPGLFFHTVILAFWTEFWGASIPCCAARFAFPVVMVRFARCVEMVRVDIEDQIGACPSLFLHRRCRFSVVGRGEVDIQWDYVSNSCEEGTRVFEGAMPDHEPPIEKQEPVLSF